MARTIQGSVGLAVAPLGTGPVQTLGAARTGHAWSTMKVPVLTTLIDEVGGHKKLSAAERQQAEQAVTASDNDSINALFAKLESKRGGLTGASHAIQKLLRRAGDPRTVVNTKQPAGGFSTFGQTLWSLPASVTFYRQLARGCVVDKSDTKYVLGLMGKIIPGERWGLGEAGFPSNAPVRFKGGWGPEAADGNKYLVRQSGIVGSGSAGIAVSIIDRPADGSFQTGTEQVTQVAKWLRKELRGQSLSRPKATCSR